MVNTISLMKRPSAFLPIAMSLVALTVVVVYIAIFGVVHQADENAAAHIFQLLIVAQLPIIGFFVARYILQRPRQTLLVLVMQVVGMLVALAPVFFFKL